MFTSANICQDANLIPAPCFNEPPVRLLTEACEITVFHTIPLFFISVGLLDQFASEVGNILVSTFTAYQNLPGGKFQGQSIQNQIPKGLGRSQPPASNICEQHGHNNPQPDRDYQLFRNTFAHVHQISSKPNTCDQACCLVRHLRTVNCVKKIQIALVQTFARKGRCKSTTALFHGKVHICRHDLCRVAKSLGKQNKDCHQKPCHSIHGHNLNMKCFPTIVLHLAGISLASKQRKCCEKKWVEADPKHHCRSPLCCCNWFCI